MEQQLDNEISLKELIEKLLSTWKYLLSKWVLIGMLGVMGAGIGFFIAWSKPIKYTARISFVAEEGKSSVGRLGIDIHATAGKGDVGFCNHWTLEISVSQSVRVYAGMPIGQLIYFMVEGDVEVDYSSKASAKYNQRSPKPVESMMWKNSF